MPDIFDEVEEDLRADRLRALLGRYSGVLLALAVIAIGGVAAWQGWGWYQARQDRAAATSFIAAMHEADATGPAAGAAHALALGQFSALSTAAPVGYRTLARLRAAAMEADAGRLPQALALWSAIAADADADPLLRQLAGFLWADRQIDTGDPALLESRLRSLAMPGAPWRSLAGEDLALLDLRLHRDAAARARLDALIGDKATEDGVRRRAVALRASIAG